MNTINVLVLLEVIFVYFCLAQSNDCVYELSNSNERPKRMPFVLDPISLKHYSLIDNKLMIPINGKILLKCGSPDGNNSLDLSSSSSFYPIFKCSNNKKLMYKDNYYDREIFFYEANCKKSQLFRHQYENNEDKCENGVKIAISYIANRTLNESDMAKQFIVDVIGICFDNVTLNPIYTHIKLSNTAQKEFLNTIGGYVNLDVIPIDFEELHEENYIPSTVDYLFNISGMNSHLNKILDNDMFFKGHKMIPVHLVTEKEIPLILSDAINTRLTRIPMWEILSKENWQLLQEDINSLVFSEDRHREFDVYAGTHGILTLPNRFGILQHLYLQTEYHYGNAVPVPEYVWKMIYSAEEKKAVAIVAYNNPYATNITESIFCKNVCDQILWLRKLDSRKILSGLVFCCEFLDFRKTIHTMPFLNDGVVELLTH